MGRQRRSQGARFYTLLLSRISRLRTGASTGTYRKANQSQRGPFAAVIPRPPTLYWSDLGSSGLSRKPPNLSQTECNVPANQHQRDSFYYGLLQGPARFSSVKSYLHRFLVNPASICSIVPPRPPEVDGNQIPGLFQRRRGQGYRFYG